MKKVLSIILAVLTVFVGVPSTILNTTVNAAETNSNLVANYSFESNGSWSPSSTTAWSMVGAEGGVTPTDGNRMMKVTSTGTNLCIGNAISVKKNTNYIFTAKIYRTDTSGVAYINLINGSNQRDISRTVVGASTAGEWVYATVEINTGNLTSIKPRLVVDGALSGRPVYFDEITLAEVSAEDNFPVAVDGIAAVETFTASSESTRADFAVTENGLFITGLSTGKQDSAQYITENVPVHLVNRANGEDIVWKYEDYTPVRIDKGIEHTVTYKSADNKYELKAVITQREGLGPLEFNQYLTGLNAPVSITYADAVSANIKLETKSNDTATLYRFGRMRVNDGSDPHFNQGGVLSETLTPGSVIFTSVENHYMPVSSVLPYQVIDINGDHGVYFGHYWSFGGIYVSMNDSREIAVRTKLGYSNEQLLIRDKNETISIPGFFIGTYEGDIDDGSNDMKNWFWNYKITRSIYENESEPYAEAGIISGWNSDMSTQFNIWPDFADYINIIKLDYLWTVPDGTAPQAMKSTEDKWIPHIKSSKNGKPYLGLYEALQKQVAKDKSDNPVYFSLYMADTFEGVDIGTKEGRERQLQALKDRMKPEDNDYGIGYEYWRSDFDVEQSYDYDDHEGLLYILDSMIEYSDDFRYEHCMGAGSLKDFTTLERMTFMTTEDTGLPLNHRMSLYANTYMIHPLQLKADLNLTISSRNYGGINPGNILSNGKAGEFDEDYVTYCVRTSMLGSSMLCLTPDGYRSGNNLKILKDNYAYYNNTLKPILRNTSVYHIMPAPTSWDWNDWDGIQYYNHELEEGVLYLFKENASAPNSKTIVLKGLDENRYYDLTFMDRTEQNVRMSGKELMTTGITVTDMTTRYDSEIVHIEEVAHTLSVTAPTQLVYHKGEELNKTGMKVEVVNAVGEVATVTDYELSGYNKDTVGKQTVTVTYDGNSSSFTVEVKEHLLETTVTKATTTTDGEIFEDCTYCEYEKNDKIAKVQTLKLSATELIYSAKAQAPTVTVLDSNGKALIQGTDYTVSLPAGRTEMGTYNITVNLTGNYSGVMSKSYSIVAKTENNKKLYPLHLDPFYDNTGTLRAGATVEIDGVSRTMDSNCIVWIDGTSSKIVTTYKYKTGSTVHEKYPTNMYVWYLTYNSATGKYSSERVKELDDIFKYEGTSIRVNFSSNGIRFFSSIPADKSDKLMAGNLLSGSMKGFKMIQAGTLYKKWTGSDSHITTSTGLSSDVFGGKSGSEFRVFSTVSGRDWFTGMLTGLEDDASTLKMDIQSRPYMTLKRNNETITIYGGTVQRSVYYVATQNKDYWAAGTAYDNYVEKLISIVKNS